MKKLLWLSVLSLAAVASSQLNAVGEVCGVSAQPSFQCPPCPIPAEVTCEYIPGSFVPAEFTPATFKQAQYCEGNVRRVVHCPEEACEVKPSCATKRSCNRGSCRTRRSCGKCGGGTCRYEGQTSRRAVKMYKQHEPSIVEEEVTEEVADVE
jgi:hypothetical protein